MAAGSGWWRMGREGAGKTTSKPRLWGREGRMEIKCVYLHLWKLHRKDGKEFKTGEEMTLGLTD